jgi:hypothetical protein
VVEALIAEAIAARTDTPKCRQPIPQALWMVKLIMGVSFI